MANLPQIRRFTIGLVTQRNVLDTPVSFAGANAVYHFDSLLDGLNMENSNFNTLKRRPGYTQYGSGFLQGNEQAINVYTFKNLAGQIRLLIDTNLRVVLYDGVNMTTIYSKTNGADWSGAAILGNRIYFADTKNNFKWDGTNLQKWGIDTPLAAPFVTFTPLQFSSFRTTESFPNTDQFEGQITVQVGSQTVQTATIPASSSLDDIVNILNGAAPAPDTLSLSYGNTQDQSGPNPTDPYITASYYFTGTVPASLIVGANVTISGNSDSALNISGTVTTVGSNYFTIGCFITSYESGTGGSVSITIPATNFNVTASKVSDGTNYRVLVVSNTIGSAGKLTLTSSVVDTTNNIAGFQFEVGNGVAVLAPNYSYSWRFVYKNSTTQHISTASDPTPSVVSQSIAGTVVLIGTGSTDPQVNTVEIYRTTDGGSVWYYSGEVPNTTSWTYVDSVPDSELNTDIIAPIDNANDPPQNGASDPVFHIDRIWYHVDNILYYTAGPDVVNGVGAEASPPANNIPAYPGKIIKKISTPQGLLIFLEDDLHLVTGLDSASYRSQKLATGLGISNPFAVVADDQIIYLYSSKQQLYKLTTTANTEIGFAIGDILKANFPAATTSLVYHRGSSVDHALYVSNGSDSIARYYVEGNSWSTIAKPVMGANVINSVELGPGDVRLLMIPPQNGSAVYYRNLNDFTDAGTTYEAFATIGIITLSMPGTMPPLVNDIIASLRKVGSIPTLSLLTEELEGDFITINSPVDDPPTFPGSKTLYSKRWYTGNTDSPLTQLIQYLQIKFSFLPENAENELFSVTLSDKK